MERLSASAVDLCARRKRMSTSLNLVDGCVHVCVYQHRANSTKVINVDAKNNAFRLFEVKNMYIFVMHRI